MLLLSFGLFGQKTVFDVISESEDHQILEALLIQSELDQTLSGSDKFTIFAPTDKAFLNIPPNILFNLGDDVKGAVTQILLRHVVESTKLASSLSNGQKLFSLSGVSLLVKIENGEVFVNNAKVTVTDIIASNGVVHVIDAVILPQPTGKTVADIIINSPLHTTLRFAIAGTNAEKLLRGEGPFTVFAPTDDAFAKMDAGILQELINDPNGKLANALLYHVVERRLLSTQLSNNVELTTANGERVRIAINNGSFYINQAKITVVDLVADNGVVHVIDAVLLPPGLPTNTVMDAIIKSTDHRILQGALNAADLSETLRGDGPFTVFAPTDKAFELLLPGVIEDILFGDLKSVQDILLGHVVAGKVLAGSLSNGMKVKTISGAEYTIKLLNGKIFIDDAEITVTDIIKDNGVVHVINAALVAKPANTIYDVVLKSPDHRILQAILGLSDGKTNLQDPTISYTLFAPTDVAFTNLPEDQLQSILDSEGKLLETVIKRHILKTKVLSSAIANKLKVKSFDDQDLVFTISGGEVFVNNAKVITADVIASNGVVHVVDQVILPNIETKVQIVPANESLIYPNPVSDVINYDFSRWAKGDLIVKIISLDGKSVKIFDKLDSKGQIHVSDLQSGLHILKVESGSKTTNKVILVNRI